MRPCGCADPAVFWHTFPCALAPSQMPPELAGPLCPRGECSRQHEIPPLTLAEALKLTRAGAR